MNELLELIPLVKIFMGMSIAVNALLIAAVIAILKYKNDGTNNKLLKTEVDIFDLKTLFYKTEVSIKKLETRIDCMRERVIKCENEQLWAQINKPKPKR